MMIADSKEKQARLQRLLHATLPPGSFEVSAPKADGTVFIRCKRTDGSSASHAAYELIDAFTRSLPRLTFVQTDDCKFRVGLDQFMP